MSVGSWFKCYQGGFLKGLEGLSDSEQAFYIQIVLRNYDSGNAVYVDSKTIGRWCNSNARKAERVIAQLIEKERLVRLPDGGLIDERALAEMADVCATRKDKVPQKIRERIAKLASCLAKHSRNIDETSPENSLKTGPLKEEENRKDSARAGACTLALEALRNACASAEEKRAWTVLDESVEDWCEGTFLISDQWAADFCEQRLSLRLQNLSLRIKRVQAQPQPLKAIAGGKS